MADPTIIDALSATLVVQYGVGLTRPIRET